jgi:hypothetical protein
VQPHLLLLVNCCMKHALSLPAGAAYTETPTCVSLAFIAAKPPLLLDMGAMHANQSAEHYGDGWPTAPAHQQKLLPATNINARNRPKKQSAMIVAEGEIVSSALEVQICFTSRPVLHAIHPGYNPHNMLSRIQRHSTAKYAHWLGSLVD